MGRRANVDLLQDEVNLLIVKRVYITYFKNCSMEEEARVYTHPKPRICINPHQHKTRICTNPQQHKTRTCTNTHPQNHRMCTNPHQHKTSICTNPHFKKILNMHQSTPAQNQDMHPSTPAHAPRYYPPLRCRREHRPTPPRHHRPRLCDS